MATKVILVLVLINVVFVKCQRIESAIDSNLIEEAIDADECLRQIQFLRSNRRLALPFLDSGIRIPKGILEGGLTDLGNYHQCLGIDHSVDEMNIQGKYCSISMPLDQILEIANVENSASWDSFNHDLNLKYEVISKMREYNKFHEEILTLRGNNVDERNNSISLSGMALNLALCIPKPCTTEEAINSLFGDLNQLSLNYTENSCRISRDKPWSGADTAATVVFSIIGLVTLLSTSYDLILYTLYFKIEIKRINPLYRSFSVYTNARRLATFNSGEGNLQCIDGIRTIAMAWVVVGHTFSSEPMVANMLDALEWMTSARALWITTATMTVDTFFTLAGILLVYTTAGKMKAKSLLMNLHWFYLNRLSRLTPLLAVAVLLQASFMNNISDGPLWHTVAAEVNKCRSNWWATLLNIQNFYDSENICVSHSWYIAIDVQLYIISPLVLYWVLTGNKRNAWLALTFSLISIIVGATIYNFYYDFQPGVMLPLRNDTVRYVTMYYVNPLTRAAPFFVGLIFGYVLHLCRNKRVALPWMLTILLWLGACGILGGIVFFKYRILQAGYENQFMDNFMNSFMRPAWACVISWIIFACVHGLSGPINWFLSLDFWRFPARLTYGMYLFHYPLMFSINASAISPVFFSVGGWIFKSMSYLVLSMIVSYVFTILVDSPISVLFKQLTTAGIKKPQQKSEIEITENGNKA